MTVQFKEGWINYPSATGRRQRKDATVTFPGSVRTHQVALKGYNVRFDKSDREILETEIDIDSTASGTSVTVSGDLVLRDSSGTYDDPYSGWINFVVMANLD